MLPQAIMSICSGLGQAGLRRQLREGRQALLRGSGAREVCAEPCFPACERQMLAGSRLKPTSRLTARAEELGSLCW